MSENKKYANVIENQRFEVSESVYYTYLKSHEAERHKDKQIRKYELSREKFKEKGITKYKKAIEDEYINRVILQRLKTALESLTEEEIILFVCFYL